MDAERRPFWIGFAIAVDVLVAAWLLGFAAFQWTFGDFLFFRSLAVALVLLAVGHLLVAAGLANRRRWARVGQLVLAAFLWMGVTAPHLGNGRSIWAWLPSVLSAIAAIILVSSMLTREVKDWVRPAAPRPRAN
jgi:peptidoglycan/LPS O-acetylase OafA/YrhL